MKTFIEIWLSDKDYDFEKKKYELYSYLLKYEFKFNEFDKNISSVLNELKQLYFIKIENFINNEIENLLILAELMLKKLFKIIVKKQITFYNRLHNQIVHYHSLHLEILS